MVFAVAIHALARLGIRLTRLVVTREAGDIFVSALEREVILRKGTGQHPWLVRRMAGHTRGILGLLVRGLVGMARLTGGRRRWLALRVTPQTAELRVKPRIEVLDLMGVSDIGPRLDRVTPGTVLVREGLLVLMVVVGLFA